MPRGRPSAGKTVSTEQIAAGTSGGRRTRSSSSMRLRELSATDEPSVLENTNSMAPGKGRGRPRKSLLANEVSASPVSAASPRIDGSPTREEPSIIVNGGSASSVTETSTRTSESGYTTPDTSKMPTPNVPDMGPRGKSIEVHIPSSTRSRSRNDAKDQALRNSVFALSRNRHKMEIGDSEDDELFDESPGGKAARRLQREEFASAEFDLPLIPLSQSTRLRSGSAKLPAKRERSDTVQSVSNEPPSKKSKAVIPDSEDLDMDQEVALAAAFDTESEELSEAPTDSDVDASDSELASDEEEDASLPATSDDEDEDDEPLSRSRSRSNANKKGKQPAIPRKSTQSQHTRNRALPQRPRRTSPSVPESLQRQESEVVSDEAWTEPSSPPASSSIASDEDEQSAAPAQSQVRSIAAQRRSYRPQRKGKREQAERDRLEMYHPELVSMWQKLKDMPILQAGQASQPPTISRQMKPFQLEGLAWMREMEQGEWKGGLLGDEMGLGKTIQAVSLIMSDYPAKRPSLVLVPPVALMQWQSEIKSYTDGTLKTFVFHGTNQKTKDMTVAGLQKYDVIMMSYNSLESMYRKQEKGFTRKNGIHKQKSLIHSIRFHRAILDEAHCIKTRSTMTAKACFALKTDYRWCLTGTPLQNRIGEFFSLIRFLNIQPFASYLCKQCSCSKLEWNMDGQKRCTKCNHSGMQHISVFNQELLNPIQRFGNRGPGKEAFEKLRLMTSRIMLRRLKKDHTNAMELPVKEIYVDRQFFGEVENDFANSIMTSGQRKFDTYVAQGVLLNNYANIFGLIMQMRQVADHPDLILKKNAEGGQNVLVCSICDEPAEDAIRSSCKHDFCRTCVSSYVHSADQPDCPRCHIALSIDLEQPGIEQDENMVKKSSIINRIKMENWTSSSKIELLVHELHRLRSDNASHKSIIFSQFTTMLQLIEWRLRRAGITTVMLDGSMTPAQRQASIEHFMNNVDVECFLVSLKAGGVALNLTEASRVFIVDPWWNPAAEWQSADRCHRIGQTRPCTITRLCIEDSVESRMVLIQEKKTNMINSTVNADDKAMESLSPEDMQFLFRGT